MLRSDIRPAVELRNEYNITFRVSEKYHVCRQANISHQAKRDISLKTFEGSNPSVKPANPSFSYPLARKNLVERRGFFNEIRPYGWVKPLCGEIRSSSGLRTDFISPEGEAQGLHLRQCPKISLRREPQYHFTTVITVVALILNGTSLFAIITENAIITNRRKRNDD